MDSSAKLGFVALAAFAGGVAVNELLRQRKAGKFAKSGTGQDEIIYLDHNATTYIDSEVADTMEPFLRAGFGNPSSTHSLGRFAKAAIRKAREQVADLLEAHSDDIVFLSGATESINWAITGAAIAAKKSGKGNHIITSSIEHEAVLEVCRFLEREHGFEITFLPVNEHGQVAVADVVAAVKPSTVLVTIMLANNEVGAVQPIAEIVTAVKSLRGAGEHEILVHCDGSQAVGKIKTSVRDLGVDYFTIAGHKFYAPKGVGALYIRSHTPPLEKFMQGAGHEGGRRAGTENTLLIVGLGKAAELASRTTAVSAQKMRTLRDRLQSLLLMMVPKSCVRVNGPTEGAELVFGKETRLPNTLSISFKDVTAPALMAKLEHRLACSAGSACHATEAGQDMHISYVLQAMGVPREFALGTLRLSVGRHTTEAEIDEAATLVSTALSSSKSSL